MQRLVYLAQNKELFVYSPDIGTNEQLTYPLEQGKIIPSIWPTWSPDGKWIAYFQPPIHGEKAKICITEVDGMEMRVLVALEDRMPIYISWSPTSTHIAVLEQSDSLELVIYPISGKKVISLDDGAPIFFSWHPSGQGIVAHLIHPIEKRSRVQYYDMLDPENDFVISTETGGFCAPVFIADQVLFAERKGDLTQVQLYDLQRREKTSLCAFTGVVAFMVRPKHNQLAISVTSKVDGSPYMGVQLFDIETGKMTGICVEPIQAFFWSNDGEKLLLSCIDIQSKALVWKIWQNEEIVPITTFRPTREQLFFLHFFEQFSLSHSIISEDGEEFYFAGYEDPSKRTIDPPQPVIFRGSLEVAAEPEVLDIGLFPSLSVVGEE